MPLCRAQGNSRRGVVLTDPIPLAAPVIRAVLSHIMGFLLSGGVLMGVWRKNISRYLYYSLDLEMLRGSDKRDG